MTKQRLFKTESKWNCLLDFGMRSKTWSQLVTLLLTSLFFARATALDITGMLMSIQEEGNYNLTWSKMFNISSDGPNINKVIWRELNDSLIDKGYKGLLEFLKCPLHTVHNAFHQGIKIGSGQSAEQLAFDFHAWFKVNIILQNLY